MKILAVPKEDGKLHSVLFHFEKLLKLHLVNVLGDDMKMLNLKNSSLYDEDLFISPYLNAFYLCN